jgi:transposase
MSERKSYTEEYKRDVLALAERIGFKRASEDLGIDKSLLYHWRKMVRQSKSDGLKAFPGQGKARDEELYQLRKENAELKEANEILKKAAVIFAQRDRR